MVCQKKFLKKISTLSIRHYKHNLLTINELENCFFCERFSKTVNLNLKMTDKNPTNQNLSDFEISTKSTFCLHNSSSAFAFCQSFSD